MDSVRCHWNGGSVEQACKKRKPMVGALSRLAELMARVEHKQEGQSLKTQQFSPSICKECGQKCSDLDSLACHQKSEHALRKPHGCRHCGQEFALASTLQLHRCLSVPSPCKVCKGKKGSSCPSCQAQVTGPHSPEETAHPLNHRLHHDDSPYACAPCGRAFSHKQDLLYHQQAGVCQPAPLSPKTLAPPPSVLPRSPDDAPVPSYPSLPPSPSGTTDCPFSCDACPKTFRTPQGLAAHQRFAHTNSWRKKKCASFPCRSCDKVFSKTTALYLHRKEEHRRESLGMRQQRSSKKSTRQQKKGETYPCSHCGKVFLHHLTRWAHFRSYSAHYQAHLAKNGNSGKVQKADRAAKDLKTAKGLKVKRVSKPSKESKLGKTCRKRPQLRLKTRRQKKAEKEDTDVREDDGEFPCPSCEEVFKTRSAFQQHEKIHQSSQTPHQCSVCAGGIALPEVDGCSVDKVYHCVPCKKAFVKLGTFLQHCTTHLHSVDDGKDGEDQPGKE
ncbi:zinc finger protein 761 [Hoplias malabaricus]|uniref:zinc finger protein 761 n=1 Tax=Hoplias malabaricus TaxID=27720 RepID=UPI003462E2A9